MKSAPLMATVAGIALFAAPAVAQYGPPIAQYGPYSPAPQPMNNVAGPHQQYSSNYGPSGLNFETMPPAYPARTYTRGPGGILLPTENYPPSITSNPPPIGVGNAPFAPYVRPPAYTGGQITNLADQLVAQSNAFLQAFLPKVRVVPQGRLFMSDATTLRNAALQFREAAANGASPAQLQAEFSRVASSWQRLENRMARVSHGYIGPNIATALQMGGTIQQIGQILP